jgi:Mn2+/Fe2+ NRAMP family transporter
VTRGLAIAPVIVVAALYGEGGTTRLLILSQVILSMQLPFAVIPLVQFVSDRKKNGRACDLARRRGAGLGRRRRHRRAERDAVVGRGRGLGATN